MFRHFLLLVVLSLAVTPAFSQSNRIFSGTVTTPQFELIPNATIEVESPSGRIVGGADAEGVFSIAVPVDEFIVRFSGKNLESVEQKFSAADRTENVHIEMRFIVPPVTENVTITADVLTPGVDNRNDAVFKNSLFGRDDQLVFTLNAGINAGQHEGGGKSLEIRRFGFNSDHGGVNGGLKILIDNVPQNQGTQGHGQGYLGALKSLSPELVDEVSIVNGPFSAVYGDFSGLGVVQIHLKEALPNVLTARVQGGSFNMRRGFFAFSPRWKNVDSFIAYEPSCTDGPFDDPLKHRRDNVSGNFTRKFSDGHALGVKFNGGRSNFFSSGQIPLDEVNTGRLDRFGAIDPENGGKVGLGNVGVYYRNSLKSGATLKADAFVGRSLFDLFSNFTFFLADPIYGDEIQQHDSRLQQGGNVQYLQPYEFAGNQSFLTIGGGVHLNQINVGLYPSIGRDPSRKFLPENLDNPNVLLTSANARVNNYSWYIQNSTALFDGHLRIDTGLRFDHFSFNVNGFELSDVSRPVVGHDDAGKFQPKLAIAWSPFENTPITVYANYGRGISSQDARGVVRNPDAPKISATDFYQAGASYNSRRLSVVFTSFLIDRSAEQVYIPDDGSIELAGRSRSYGVEVRSSFRLNRYVSFNGGLTQVIRAYFPGQFNVSGERLIVDSAPHTVANGGLVLSELRGFNVFLNWRHINSYRLDADDSSIKAAGHDVVDLSLTKKLTKNIDLNFSVDNVLSKKYYETQNYFESRISPTADLTSRIHATPGYPLTVSAGVTFRFGAKN